MLKFALRLTLSCLACMSVYVLAQKPVLSVAALSQIDPLPETRALAEEDRLAEAAGYLGFFMEYDYVRENPEAQALFGDISSRRDAWLYQAGKLVEGFFTGKSDETLGQAAGVVSDFLVIGDLRDLTIQGINWSSGEEVDPVVTALASLGVLASGAQLAGTGGTVATGGAAAPTVVGATAAKSGIVLLKAARKLGKMPPWLAKTLMGAVKTVKETKSFATLAETFNDVRKLAGTRGGFHLLSVTTDAASLRRMVTFADVFGENAATLYRIGGTAVVDAAQRVGELGKDTIKLAATYGQEGLRLLNRMGATTFAKLASRTSKVIYKGTLAQLAMKMLRFMPEWALYALVILGIAIWIPPASLMTLFAGAFARDQASPSDPKKQTLQGELEQVRSSDHHQNS